MNFAAVARVTDSRWIACVTLDRGSFGLRSGSELPIHSTICCESRRKQQPIYISDASSDPVFRDHPAPKLYGFESCVTLPIFLQDGSYFGNLCALASTRIQVSVASLNLLSCCVTLIARGIDSQRSSDEAAAALRRERETAQLREQFIAILGHDLRNPLHAIRAESTLIERRASDAAAVKSLAERIGANARRMSTMIDEILDFARAKLGGGMALSIGTHNLGARLGHIVEEVRDAHPSREIRAAIGDASSVRCDPDRLMQVAVNLIANALAHGDARLPVKVTAELEATEFVMKVWNGGEAIPMDVQKRMFEPFWRNEISPKSEGLGLGLHICSQIVKAHGGALTCHSDAIDGTTFTVRIPAESESQFG